MATKPKLSQLSLIKINDFKGVVIRVYHFSNWSWYALYQKNYLFWMGYIS